MRFREWRWGEMPRVTFEDLWTQVNKSMTTDRADLKNALEAAFNSGASFQASYHGVSGGGGGGGGLRQYDHAAFAKEAKHRGYSSNQSNDGGGSSAGGVKVLKKGAAAW